jgi:hypothetical protein
MEQAKHTPGPWQQHSSHVYGPDPERRLIAQFVNPGSSDDGRMQADMTLACAATGLLENLEAYVKHCPCVCSGGRMACCNCRAQAAIRKATGATK